MTSIQFAPKWPRLARLSLALPALAAPVCTLAQSKNAPKYTIVDLGPVGPSWSQGQPFKVSGNGLVSGERVLPNPNNPAEWVSHAVVWEGTSTKVKTIAGLGGPNSVAFGVNIWGQAAGQADTQTPDPNGEDFCGSTALGLTHSGNTCVPFLWQNGADGRAPQTAKQRGHRGQQRRSISDQRLWNGSGNGGKRRIGLDLSGRICFAADHRVQACHLDETLPLVADAASGASHP